jgi:cell wall-associated NlpC family hydrolase
MARSGAAGKRGLSSINQIVRRFERPADPDAEVQKAFKLYKDMGAPKEAFAYGTRVAGLERGYQEQMAQGLVGQTKLDLVDKLGPLSGRVARELNLFGEDDPRQFEPPISKKTGALPGLAPGAKNPKAQQVLAMAHKQIGQDYVWGGESRKEGGFDCSGLIQWAYGRIGIKMPRLAGDQGNMGRPVKLDTKHLRPGDLISAKDRHHIVMYVGGGRVIAAPSRGKKVQYQPVSAFLGKEWKANRVL